MLHLVGQDQSPHKVGEVVSQGVKLEPSLVPDRVVVMTDTAGGPLFRGHSALHIEAQRNLSSKKA